MRSARFGTILTILLSAMLLSSCVPTKKWERATITFNDNSEKDALVYFSPMSYYNFFRAKYSPDERRTIYPPDSVKSVKNDNFAYNSFFFDEERFGMESYGFVKQLAGNELYVGVTKYKMKTCACKTSGGYFKGYFIAHNDNYLRIELDLTKRLRNINELNKFIEDEGFDFEIPLREIYLDELLELIEKVGI